MNTLLIITLAVAIPVYAMLWHNRPARTQQVNTTAIEAAVTILLNLSWLTRIAALVAQRVTSNMPTKRRTACVHAHGRKQLNRALQ